MVPKGFAYAAPVIGHPAFIPAFRAIDHRLGQPVAPPVVVQQAPPVAATPAPTETSGGTPLIAVILVGAAVWIGLEVGGVTHVLGLEKVQKWFKKK